MYLSDIPEITHLSIPEKILLLEELWDTIASEEEEIPVPQSHINELERRFEMHGIHPGNLLTLDELRGRLAKRK